jgi:tRNA-Thr(GGU) m(6)t(6)A37 methyltransferase TsaA
MSFTSEDPIYGFGLAAVSFVLWNCYKEHQNSAKWEKAYWGERRGRARVEQEMKRISNIQLNTDEGFFVQPIGTIESCYRQCIGTPRQGLLAPSSRATIKLTAHVSPEALVGLESFSHVWITFKFHLNTNTLKESRSFSSRSTFNAKIKPPMLKKKVGVFATRSPHRPNPVGVTLARIDRIDKRNRTVHLLGCDLVQGTPVLDVKVSALAEHNASFVIICSSCLKI